MKSVGSVPKTGVIPPTEGETMRTFIKLVFLVVMLAVLFAGSAYSNAKLEDLTVQIPRDKILIINGSGQTLKFELSKDQKDWNDFNLKAGEDQLYPSTYKHLKIATDGKPKPKIRQLNAKSRRYVLAWNVKEGCWDVFFLPVKR